MYWHIGQLTIINTSRAWSGLSHAWFELQVVKRRSQSLLQLAPSTHTVSLMTIGSKVASAVQSCLAVETEAKHLQGSDVEHVVLKDVCEMCLLFGKLGCNM